MTSEEWGVLFPWGTVSVQGSETDARRLYFSLLNTELIRVDGSVQVLDNLKLVRRFVQEWKEVDP